MMNENEQEHEKRETVADIVAELRNKTGDMYDCTITTDEEEFHSYADRIEAAWKRERDRLMTEPRSWEECVERAMKVKENSDVLY